MVGTTVVTFTDTLLCHVWNIGEAGGIKEYYSNIVWAVIFTYIVLLPYDWIEFPLLKFVYSTLDTRFNRQFGSMFKSKDNKDNTNAAEEITIITNNDDLLKDFSFMGLNWPKYVLAITLSNLCLSFGAIMLIYSLYNDQQLTIDPRTAWKTHGWKASFSGNLLFVVLIMVGGQTLTQSVNGKIKDRKDKCCCLPLVVLKVINYCITLLVFIYACVIYPVAVFNLIYVLLLVAFMFAIVITCCACFVGVFIFGIGCVAVGILLYPFEACGLMEKNTRTAVGQNVGMYLFTMVVACCVACAIGAFTKGPNTLVYLCMSHNIYSLAALALIFLAPFISLLIAYCIPVTADDDKQGFQQINDV